MNVVVLTIVDPVWPAEGRSHGSLKQNTYERIEIEGFRAMADVVDADKHLDLKRQRQL